MDALAAYFLVDGIREIYPNMDIQFRTEITGSTLGFATADNDLFKLLESFLDANAESLEYLRSIALTKQVSSVLFKFFLFLFSIQFILVTSLCPLVAVSYTHLTLPTILLV